MKNTITIIASILSLLIILDCLNFRHALIIFYLAGVIPGTDIAIGAAQMLQLFAFVGGFTVARVMSYIMRSFKPSITSISNAQVR